MQHAKEVHNRTAESVVRICISLHESVCLISVTYATRPIAVQICSTFCIRQICKGVWCSTMTYRAPHTPWKMEHHTLLSTIRMDSAKPHGPPSAWLGWASSAGPRRLPPHAPLHRGVHPAGHLLELMRSSALQPWPRSLPSCWHHGSVGASGQSRGSLQVKYSPLLLAPIAFPHMCGRATRYVMQTHFLALLAGKSSRPFSSCQTLFAKERPLTCNYLHRMSR